MSPISASVRTDLLELHYFESGPQDGPPVILLHGWPDSAVTWDPIRASLNALGYRTIAPFLRGFGPSRFLSPAIVRSAQITALARDVLDLTDHLGLAEFFLVGHDWGARAAYVLAAQVPHRVARLVALSVGYGPAPLSLVQAQQFWYQWFFAHPQGEAQLRADRRALCRYLWRTWSPSWSFSDDEFDATALAFDNPDWLAMTLHGYRHRWGLAPGDERYAALEARQQTTPAITTPTLMVHGAADACIHPESSVGLEHRFSGAYRRVVLPGVGHFPQREATGQTGALIANWFNDAGAMLVRSASSAIKEKEV